MGVEEHGQHRVPLPLGMRKGKGRKKKESNGKDIEGGEELEAGKQLKKLSSEPIITYEGEKSWTVPAGMWDEDLP